MNFKLKLYYRGRVGEIPEEADIVFDDPDFDEMCYVGTIRDYSMAQELVKRWNEYDR